jgi:hypothetical protein
MSICIRHKDLRGYEFSLRTIRKFRCTSTVKSVSSFPRTVPEFWAKNENITEIAGKVKRIDGANLGMSKASLDFSNEYARNARLKPALLVSLPLATLTIGYGLKSSIMLGALFGPLAAAGFTYLLAHLTRDFGVRRQVELFRSWGGKPSITKLRHRDVSLNPYTRARYHQKAAELLGRPMPTVAEEEADPAAADSLYEAYSNVLLERTRDTKVFRLLFEELVSYGFRRNLLSMKTLGLWLCIFCTVCEAVLLVRVFRITGQIEASNALFAGLDLFLLLCWWLLITPNWVRRAADAYAERLLAASENLQTSVRASRTGAPRRPRRDATRATTEHAVHRPEEGST